MLVRDVMTRDPVAIQADAPIREAAALLRKHNIGGLPVVEGGRLVGMITESDILRLLQTMQPHPFDCYQRTVIKNGYPHGAKGLHGGEVILSAQEVGYPRHPPCQ